ncbi:cell death regulator Aven [Ixodes scapularis]|uniref:cell death regulator Aven n=1 Tax=Ixodes scapularis TaxID=6945 RepID=UPI001A9F09AE|nr:cell death regulator Aven [Ixodes scapularis]XP_040077364.1 cell death regulator Aven [Ixodes scapularis]XP_040077365.1 cell death regulator Aven [Ixodes scapularis]
MTPGPKQRERRRDVKQKKHAQAAVDVEAPPAPASTEKKNSVGSSAVDTSRTSEQTLATSVAAPIEPPCDPQFRKRGITSNWGRYEEPLETETDYNRKKGEDFELLLSTSVGSSAHFRFKEQQDWQDDLHIDEFLSVDCDALADALQTIPLHKRLELPEEIFPPEILKQYNEDAASHRQKYGGGKICSWKNASSVSDSLTSTLLTAAGATSRSTKVKGQGQDDLSRSLGACLSLSSGQQTQGRGKSPKEEEDDLDFLLSLSSTAKPDQEIEKQDGPKEPTESSDLPMRPVDQKSTMEPVAQAVQKPTIDLEDWLDSVLQD